MVAPYYRAHVLVEGDGAGGYKVRTFKAVATPVGYAIDGGAVGDIQVQAVDFAVTPAGAIKYSSAMATTIADLVIQALAKTIPNGKAVSIAAAVGTTAATKGGTTKPITAKAALTCSECNGSGFYTSPISAKQSPCSRGCKAPAVPAGATK